MHARLVTDIPQSYTLQSLGPWKDVSWAAGGSQAQVQQDERGAARAAADGPGAGPHGLQAAPRARQAGRPPRRHLDLAPRQPHLRRIQARAASPARCLPPPSHLLRESEGQRFGLGQSPHRPLRVA